MTQPKDMYAVNGFHNVRHYGKQPAESRMSHKLLTGLGFASVIFTVGLLASLNTTPIHFTPATPIHFTPASINTSKTVASFEAMNKVQIYEQLLEKGSHFQAIAVLLEGVETSVYKDSGGWSIGAGYCVSRQVANKGRARVIDELHQAGIPIDKATMLADPKKRHQVKITKEQAVNLLRVTQVEFEKTASKWLGKNHFDRLDEKQKASVTYLAYNVGGSNLHKFKALRAAIRSDSHEVLHVEYSDGTHGSLILGANKMLKALHDGEIMTFDLSAPAPTL